MWTKITRVNFVSFTSKTSVLSYVLLLTVKLL